MGACAAGFVAIAGYAIHNSHQAAATAEEAPQAASGSADPNVILAGMPGAGAIPAAGALRGRQAPPPAGRNDAAAAPAGSAPATATAAPVDEVRQAALKEAWSRYYQDAAQLAQQRREAARGALIADTTYQGTSDGGQPASTKNGTTAPAEGNAAPGASGLAPAAQQQAHAGVPGSLYQGPSRAADDYLNATVTPPLTHLELKAGDPIQVRFVTGVSSDAPGSFRAVVSQPVFDHATGLHILIPQGAFVVGSYDHTQEIGTGERLPAGATRIIFPGDSADSLDLGSMPLSDQAGYAGLHDQVNHHYLRLVFNTLLLGLGGAGAQLTQPQGGAFGGYNASQILAAQLGQQFGQVGAQYAQQQLAAKPTHTIRPGYTGTLHLTQDVAFPGEWIEGRGFVFASAR